MKTLFSIIALVSVPLLISSQPSTKLADNALESDNQLLSKQSNFELGAKWIYEREVRIPPIVDFVTYEVVDEFPIDSMDCYTIDKIVEQNQVVGSATICVNGNRVLVPDARLSDGYQLIYDFEAVDTFTTQCSGLNVFFDCSATVDSVAVVEIADGQLLTRRNIDVEQSSPCFSLGFLPSRVYDGVGNDYGGLLSNIDFCNIIGDPFDITETRLRCFENSTESYRFVDYPCDSVWTKIQTNVDDFTGTQDHFLYPNPADGLLYVQNPLPDLTYRIMSIEGKLISEGDYSDDGIVIPHRGLVIVTLIYNGKEWTSRVVNF